MVISQTMRHRVCVISNTLLGNVSSWLLGRPIDMIEYIVRQSYQLIIIQTKVIKITQRHEYIIRQRDQVVVTQVYAN